MLGAAGRTVLTCCLHIPETLAIEMVELTNVEGAFDGFFFDRLCHCTLSVSLCLLSRILLAELSSTAVASVGATPGGLGDHWRAMKERDFQLKIHLQLPHVFSLRWQQQ